MSQSINDVFATFPQVVCAHFHSRRMQTLDRLQGHRYNLEFRSEVGSRGPGTIRVVSEASTSARSLLRHCIPGDPVCFQPHLSC